VYEGINRDRSGSGVVFVFPPRGLLVLPPGGLLVLPPGGLNYVMYLNLKNDTSFGGGN
jgi:hypothetical protein